MRIGLAETLAGCRRGAAACGVWLPALSSHSGVPARNVTPKPPGVHSAGEPGPLQATVPLLSPLTRGVTVRLAAYTDPVEPALPPILGRIVTPLPV
jgi:hypothetical protein